MYIYKFIRSHSQLVESHVSTYKGMHRACILISSTSHNKTNNNRETYNSTERGDTILSFVVVNYSFSMDTIFIS